ncbi:hypothetical protein MRX96_059285 [Rhipicephalus microplus]
MDPSSEKVVEKLEESDSVMIASMPEDSASLDNTTGVGTTCDSIVFREMRHVRPTAHVVSIDTRNDQMDCERAYSAAVLGGEVLAEQRIVVVESISEQPPIRAHREAAWLHSPKESQLQ